MASATLFAFFSAINQQYLASIQPVILYIILLGMVLNPFDVMHRKSRHFFCRTVARIALPLYPVSYADFFLADIFTSMAKAVSDTERAVCSMAAAPVLEAAALVKADLSHTCGHASWQIPLVLSLPYLARLIQCVRLWRDSGEKMHLVNAMKYCSTFPVIFLSAMKYHVTRDVWENIFKLLWLCFAFFNSAFSFYWDIIQDWDFLNFPKRDSPKGSLLKSELLYKNQGFYYWAVVSNFFLRIAWTYKLSAHLRHNQGTVFIISILEVFRRFQWVLLRVEKSYNHACRLDSKP